MKPATIFISAALIVVITAFAAIRIIIPTTHQNIETKKTSAFDRITKTNTIRCGYVVYSPYLVKDANTGKLSGIFYDLTEKIGQLLKLKIEWTQETTFATYAEDMRTGRYDMYCAGLWPEANRSRFSEFSKPVNYAAMGLYVRADDTRFDNNIALLNNKAYRLATLDGEMADIVAKEDFPNAQTESHTHNTDVSQLVMDVVTHKADAVAIEKSVAEGYNAKNPGTLKNLTADKPIRIFPNTWAVARGNSEVIDMLNVALEEMQNTGAIDKIIRKYDPGMTYFYPVAAPYQAVVK